MKILINIALLFTISCFTGFTAWKAYDSGLLNRVSSPLNPNIYQRAYDVRYFDSLPKDFPESITIKYPVNFKEVLSEAIAWEKPVLNKINLEKTINSFPYTQISLSYSYPPTAIKAIFKPSTNIESKTLFMVLPGYGMNMTDVFSDESFSLSGLADSIDSWNYDMMIINPIYSPYMAAGINTRLTMSGLQMHGFQARQVCDSINYMKEINNYESIMVYGIGSGGLIADLVSLTCNLDMLVIIDGLPIPLNKTLWQTIRLHITDNPLIYQFQAPLLEYLNIGNFSYNTNSNKVYLLDKISIRFVVDELENNLSPISKFNSNKNILNKFIFYIEKTGAKNVSFNNSLVKKIVDLQVSSLAGWYIEKDL